MPSDLLSIGIVSSAHPLFMLKFLHWAEKRMYFPPIVKVLHIVAVLTLWMKFSIQRSKSMQSTNFRCSNCQAFLLTDFAKMCTQPGYVLSLTIKFS